MAASGPSSTMARASVWEKPGRNCLRTESRVSSTSMLGTEQLQHGRIHFATAAEAFFRQPIRTKIHYLPRQSAEGLLLLFILASLGIPTL